MLSSAEWAQIMVEESRALGVTMTPREIAEGLGVLEVESHRNASEAGGLGGATGHIGGWQEEQSYGTTAERLDPRASTRSALKHWLASGKSWWTDWGQYETGAEGGAGPSRWKQYLPTAEGALGARASFASTGTGTSRGEASAAPAAPAGLSGTLMHIGLTVALVGGGAALVMLGTTRVFGAGKQSA